MEMSSEISGSDAKTTKNKIRNAVNAYIRAFPDEFEDVKTLVAQKKRTLHTQFGELRGDHAMNRILFEIPETLNNLLIKNLDTNQMIWFKTKEGARWFAKTFPPFALAEV